jgi:TolB protein
LYWKSVDGVAITQLTSDPASDIQPAFSRDGARIAFSSNRAGNWDIWVIGTDGGPAVQITRGIADDVHPSWSPDGTKLVYTSLPPNGGPGQLWIADALAGGTARFIGYGLFPNWSPADDLIVYQRARERESRWFSIWTVRLVNGEPRYPTEVAADVSTAMIQPSFSYDGRRIGFVGTASIPPAGITTEHPPVQAYDIWVMNVDGRNRIRLTDGITANYAPAFSPDGRVFFTSNRSGHESIWSLLAPLPESGPAATVADRLRTPPDAIAAEDWGR